MVKMSVKLASWLLISAALLSIYPVSATTTNEETEGLLDLSSPNGVSLEFGDCESILGNSVLGKNEKLENCSSKQSIIASIKSNDVFSMDGTIVTDLGKYDVSEYYDFSEVSKYDIANWAFENGLITEEEKIDCYCDLFLLQNFDNIFCLEGVFDEIQQYSNKNALAVDLDEKIGAIFANGTASPDAVVLPSDFTTYNSNNFTIHYNIYSISLSDVKDVANYFEQVREQYINDKFVTPLLEKGSTRYNVWLNTGVSSDNSLGATTKVSTNGNTCSSYISIFKFSKLDDDIKDTIAHEYFHAIQNAYNHQSGWFKEACATLSTYYFSRDFKRHNAEINDFISNIGTTSLLEMKKSLGYGVVLFPMTIFKDFGGISTIRKIYEEYNNYDVIDDSESSTEGRIHSSTILRSVIDKVMTNNGYSGGFNEVYRNMAAYLHNVQFFYSELANTDGWHSKINGKNISALADTSVSETGSTIQLTSQYYRIYFPSGYKGTATIVVISASSSCYTQTYYENNGTPEITLNSKVLTTSAFQVQIGDGISTVALVVSNLSSSASANYTIAVALS